MTLEKPPKTLGETQFESSAFTVRQNLQQKFQQLNKCTYLDFRASTLPWKMCQTGKTQNRKFIAFITALNAEMTFSKFVPPTSSLSPRFSCLESAQKLR